MPPTTVLHLTGASQPASPVTSHNSSQGMTEDQKKENMNEQQSSNSPKALHDRKKKLFVDPCLPLCTYLTGASPASTALFLEAGSGKWAWPSLWATHTPRLDPSMPARSTDGDSMI